MSSLNPHIRIGLLLLAVGTIIKVLVGSLPITEFANGLCVGLSAVLIIEGLLKCRHTTAKE